MDTTVTYKAFSNQVAKPRFADFARDDDFTARQGHDAESARVRQEERAFAECRHILIQDGSSFAIHDGLREVCPGRFKVVKPAAVELHTTMDWLCAAPTTVVLTPDPTNEQAFLPAPASLAPVCCWRIVAISIAFFRRVQDAGGFLSSEPKPG